MAGELPMTVLFTGEERSLVEFPAEGVTVSIPHTRVEEGLYRLDRVPVSVESAGYRDIAEAEPVEGRGLRVKRVADRSDWRTYDYILPPSRAESEAGRTMIRELKARGGHWELVFGDLLFICVPAGLDFDPSQWLSGA